MDCVCVRHWGRAGGAWLMGARAWGPARCNEKNCACKELGVRKGDGREEALKGEGIAQTRRHQIHAVGGVSGCCGLLSIKGGAGSHSLLLVGKGGGEGRKRRKGRTLGASHEEFLREGQAWCNSGPRLLRWCLAIRCGQLRC